MTSPLNDVHSRLNASIPFDEITPHSVDELLSDLQKIGTTDKALIVSGGRHAMGGQQFLKDGIVIDSRRMNRVIQFDRSTGILHAEAGLQWPELFDVLERAQVDGDSNWGVRQTQTGASRFSLGGSISANIHGRGLTLRPIVQDVEAIHLANLNGETIRCSREEHSELFAATIGGYGLFGPIVSVELRLARRELLERHVEIVPREGLMVRFNERISSGYLYGDWQFAVDRQHPDMLDRGIFSCYRPVDRSESIRADQKYLSREDWSRLLYLAHTDPTKGFEEYAAWYTSTNGQRYWSDVHQLGDYIDGYHDRLDLHAESSVPGSEMITELYVPRDELESFLAASSKLLQQREAQVIFGTVRLIEQESETLLPWARQSWACTIFNLHVDHSPVHIERTADTFRLMIDLALEYGGTYYLTYHRWARRDQVERAYPDFQRFLTFKQSFDPETRYASDWYLWYREMFG